jgi:hypothetical protein
MEVYHAETVVVYTSAWDGARAATEEEARKMYRDRVQTRGSVLANGLRNILILSAVTTVNGTYTEVTLGSWIREKREQQSLLA